jgi:hypothetical protein
MLRLSILVSLTVILAALAAVSQLRAEDRLTEEEAVQALVRVRTNLQHHRDGTVRLVRFSRPKVTDEDLAPIAAFTNLEYLAVVCPLVTDAGLAPIARLTNLDTLLLSESGVTDPGLAHLAGLEKLERLYLADTAITDAGLAHLAPLEELKTLSLARTKVRGPGLADLASLTNLEHLDLIGTAIDDAAVDALQRLTSLTVLELNGTNLTAEGIDRLQRALPETAIYFDRSAPDESTAVVEAVSAEPTTSNELTTTAPLPPIHKRLSASETPPDFQRHVVPLLGRLGCNGRACHGSFQGQGGFRLSMFGYDFAMDHENLSDRVDLDAPEESLILHKPTSADEHGGGLRLPPGGWEQMLLRRWIEAGARGAADDSPKFLRLEVTPPELVFAAEGETQQLTAVAVWSDGMREEVTCLTRFEPSDDAVAHVSPDGLVTARGKGDAHVIAFYDNGIVPVPAIFPVTELAGERYPRVPQPTRIDELIVAKLAKLGVVPSELCTDEEFIRRVNLDLIGTLPTPDEVRDFIADTSPEKRSRKIDELLEREAYVTWWTTRLCDLTGSNAGYLGSTEMAQPVAAQWRAWIERRVRDNVGWDEIVRGIVLATSRRPGQSYRDFIAEQSAFTRSEDPDDFAAAGNPMPHFWFRNNIGQPTDKALAFGYTFLGVRLDCAQCHKHPYDQWSKQDFEQFTEFFTRIEAGLAPDAVPLHRDMQEMLGVPEKLNTAALRRQEYLRVAAEGRPIPWREIFIAPPGEKPQPARLLGGAELDLREYDDPREPLMEWLVTEPNRYLAKAFVNRIWANYFHRGLVDPPDDLNLANPPSNRAVLDYLTGEFIARSYDMKWLHRTIAGSRTYQLSWRPNKTNRTDQQNHSRAVPRRLPAEVAIDAVIQATSDDKKAAELSLNTKDRKIGQHPRSYQARAIDFSLLVFGKPLRTTNCDCERKSEPTLLQALYLRNDTEVLEWLDRADGWLAQVAAEGPQLADGPRLIEEAYLRTLSRRPSEAESADCRAHLAECESVVEGLRDLMWALLNTQEFITNH